MERGFFFHNFCIKIYWTCIPTVTPHNIIMILAFLLQECFMILHCVERTFLCSNIIHLQNYFPFSL